MNTNDINTFDRIKKVLESLREYADRRGKGAVFIDVISKSHGITFSTVKSMMLTLVAMKVITIDPDCDINDLDSLIPFQISIDNLTLLNEGLNNLKDKGRGDNV